jgi:hypothetical protein
MTKRRGSLMRGSELVEYSRKADAERDAKTKRRRAARTEEVPDENRS